MRAGAATFFSKPMGDGRWDGADPCKIGFHEGSIPSSSTMRPYLNGRESRCQRENAGPIPAGRSIFDGRRLWRAGEPYKLARPAGRVGTGGFDPHGAYCLMRGGPGPSRSHKPAKSGSTPLSATNRRVRVAGARACLKSKRIPFDSVTRHHAGIVQGIGPQSSKLMMSVRVRLSAPFRCSSKAERTAVNRATEVRVLSPEPFTGVFWRTTRSPKPRRRVRFLPPVPICAVSQVGRARSCNLRERGSIPRPHSTVTRGS